MCGKHGEILYFVAGLILVAACGDPASGSADSAGVPAADENDAVVDSGGAFDADGIDADDTSDVGATDIEADTLPPWCPADGSPAESCPCVLDVDQTCCARPAEAWSCDDFMNRGTPMWSRVFDCVCEDHFFCPPEYEQPDYPYCGYFWEHWQ